MNTKQDRPIKKPKKKWVWITRIGTAIIIVLVLALLINLGRKLDWAAVLQSARDIGTPTIAIAMCMALLGHLVYSTFDVLAKRYAGTHLPYWKVMGIASLSYAMNLNLGVLLGGVAIRFRLYHRLGVGVGTASRVVVFSTLTNWIGYGWLAGLLFMSGVVPTPGSFDIGRYLLQAIGLAMFSGVGIYLALCAWSRRRTWTIRSHEIELPPVKLAFAQCGLAAISWSLMGGIIFLLLDRQIDYPVILGILLFCSIAAVIAHIPGGLGVTEAIFVAALGGLLPGHEVLAAVLMYRVLYCIVPLCIALPTYLIIEARMHAKQRPHKRTDSASMHRVAGPSR